MRKGFPKKYPVLRDQILAFIQEQNYRMGDRIPSITELAERFHTSYVTVTKAIKLLVAEGYIDSRQGVGNFVHFHLHQMRPQRKVVNLVYPRMLEGITIVDCFRNDGKKLFQNAGWEVRVCPVENDPLAIRVILNDVEAYSVIFELRPYWGVFSADIAHARERVVLLGERSEQNHIACITSDETQTIRLVMEDFIAQGYKKVALICANLKSSLEMHRAAAWHSLGQEAGLPFWWRRDFCFDMKIPPMAPVDSFVDRIADQLMENNRYRDVDGIITPDDEVAMKLIGRLLDRGIRVPEDVAVVGIGNGPLCEVFRPQISSVDHNFPAHLQTALEVLESRFAGAPDRLLIYLCQPKLHVRASSMKQGTGKEDGMAATAHPTVK